MSGTLYLVASPIGNLSDISFRAIETLRNVDFIACEDTRHSKILLDRYEIKKSLFSYHKFNIKGSTDKVIEKLLSGSNIALISDAGTPAISDPGYELVKAAIIADIKVEMIPGASALISALAVSGLNTDKFVFEGFFPATGAERKKRLKNLSTEERTVILYEAPHRLLKTLEDILAVFGDRNACVARELTKMHEELNRGSVSTLIAHYSKITPKGEIVLLIEGIEQKENEPGEYLDLLRDLVKAGITKSEAARILSKRLGLSKNALYRLLTEI